jgi:hypothetical protein
MRLLGASYRHRTVCHNSNLFVSCINHILYTGCAKIKQNNSGAKMRLLGASYRQRTVCHNSNVFVSCIIHILYTGCAKIKKNQFRHQNEITWSIISSENSFRRFPQMYEFLSKLWNENYVDSHVARVSATCVLTQYVTLPYQGAS